MAFTTSWIYKAVDKYTPTAKKIALVNLKVRKSLVQMGRAADEANRKLEKTEKRFRSLNKVADKFKKFGIKMTAFVTLPVALLGRAMFRAASDATETESKFNEVFKSMSASANNTADAFSKSFDLAGSTARELLGDTGFVLAGFGFTEKKALDLSLQINELAADLTSFTNIQGGVPRASSAITKALLGEREALKGLGVSILEVDVKQKIAKQKTEGLTFASLRQAKAFATLTLIQERSANAVGDYARTQTQAANVSRAFEERVKNLNEKFGKVFLPIATKVIGKLTVMVDALAELSPGTKKAILVVGGLVAVLGPLALAIGGLIAIAPAMAAGFAIMFGPIGIAVTAAVALLALLSRIKDRQSVVEGTGGQRRRQLRQRSAAARGATDIPSGAAALAPSAAAEIIKFEGRENKRRRGGQSLQGKIDMTLRSEKGMTAEATTEGFQGSEVSFDRGRNLAGAK